MARRSTPRAKTGCATCRIRRVKCDETKPHCLRCAQTGRKCDGFPVPGPGGGPAATPPPALPLRSVASYSIPFRVPGSQKDRQLLHYFCVQGATDVSGFCRTAFWSHTVLQACQSNAAVRQALVALSSLHIDLATPDCHGAEAGVQEATLARYGLALRALRRRVDKQDPEEKKDEAVIGALICCVLFYGFESALGNSKAAMRHLGSGLSLWAAHYSKPAANRDGCLDEISDVLARLDMQASFFDDSRAPTLPLVSADQRVLGLRICPAQAFSGLADAQRELVKLQNWLLRFLLENLAADSGLQDTGIPGPILQEKKLLLSELGAWRRSIARLGECSPSADGVFLCSFQTLLVQHDVAQMLLASRVPDDDSVFGAVPNPAAEEVIRLAESVVRLHSNGDAASRRTVSSETGIVAPLALLAIKCADTSLSRRAVKLLIASDRREGLYDATTMATIVQRMELLRQQRMQHFKSGQESSVASLEHWTADAIDQAEGGMDNIGDRLAEMMEAGQKDAMLTGTMESTT